MAITRTHLESVGILQVPQRSPTPQTSNWSGTIFCRFLQQTGSSEQKHFLMMISFLTLTGPMLDMSVVLPYYSIIYFCKYLRVQNREEFQLSRFRQAEVVTK